MLPQALKVSWLNSQELRSEENQTRNFHFLYTYFQHRKGHSQQNNKLCLPLACEIGSDGIKLTSRTLQPPCFSFILDSTIATATQIASAIFIILAQKYI